MKNILLLVHDDAGEEARYQAALDVTRAVSGHLTCLDVVQIPYLVGTDYMMADVEAVLLEDVRTREAANKQRLEKRLQGEDVSWSWVDWTGDMVPALEREARLADLIVLNSGLLQADDPEAKAVLAEVAVHSGRPVLAVPGASARFDPTGHALIAWNGSTAAAETLRAVVPLLKLAESVSVVQIGETKGATIEEAGTYLSRHGIHARLDTLPVVGSDAGATLLGLCEARKPAYFVMGAYGHSRLKEGLFGGVTRTLLSRSPVPLIIGH